MSRLIADGLVVGAVLLWWAMSYRLPSFVLPGPWEVAVTLSRLFFDGAFVIHTAVSAARVIGSVAIALVLGGALALLPRWLPVLDEIVRFRITPVLNSFPSIGWAILAAIWFDVSTFSIMFVQVAILIPFCLINLSEGLRELDRELVEMARSFTRSGWRVLWRIVLPLLLPYIVAALRIAYGIGWKIALVAELLGARSGLGFLMLRAQTSADTPMVFATSFAIVLIFIAGERLVIDPLARLAARR